MSWLEFGTKSEIKARDLFIILTIIFLKEKVEEVNGI